jgi:hypothetical protein
MSRFRNSDTDVVVSVSDDKDERFGEGWVSADSQPSGVPPKRGPGRPKKTDESITNV